MLLRHFSYMSLVALIAVTPLVAGASCGLISRNLSVGAKGKDVFRLQIFLNKNRETQVALSGPGSSNNETEYFGPMLKKAVSKYQLNHKKELLSPLGLKNPTGIVGLSTRKYINESLCATIEPAVASANQIDSSRVAKDVTSSVQKNLEALIAEKKKLLEDQLSAQLAEAQIDPNPTSATETPSLPATDVPVVTAGTALPLTAEMENAPLQAYYLDSNVVLPGARVGIIGSGIYSGTVARVGARTFPVEIIRMGEAASVIVPTDVELGVHELVLERGFKKSNSRMLVVVKSLSDVPRISSVTPQNGSVGSEITLKGSGFAQKNDLYTTGGVIRGVESSDGTTMKFSSWLDPEFFYTQGKNLTGIDYYITIVNENGISAPASCKI